MHINQQMLIYIGVSLLLSALFSGIEIAFISANRLHIELQAKKGVLSSRILRFFVNKPAFFIGTSLIGNTIALVAFSTLMTSALNPYFKEYSEMSFLLIQTIISTIIVLIFAEYLPKSLFLLNPNRLLSVLIYPFIIAAIILCIPVFLIVNLSKFILTKLFKTPYSEELPVFSLTDLNHYIQKITPTEENNEESNTNLNTDILNNALEFKSVKVRECMIPRIDIVAIENTASIDELREIFIKTGYSKILVYKETIDNLIGYVHSSVLFKKPKTIDEVLSKLIIAPETKPANELLPEFTKEHKSIALVVDEFGGTAGIITIEDIVEKIFGEIQDEHDDENLIEIQLDDNSFIFSSRHEVEYLNEKYELDIPEGDYETLSGYILNLTGDIPKEADVIATPQLKILIKTMVGIRIDKVQIFVSNS